MNLRADLPQNLRDQPFTRSSAKLAGVARSRLRARDLERPFHAVFRSVDGPSGFRWLCRAYQERMNPAHCFSHQTAAELYGLPLPLYAASGQVVHVATSAASRAPSGVNVMGHRIAQPCWSRRELVLRDNELDHLFAFPVSTPELVWAQLAEVLDVDDLVALGDAIVGGSANQSMADIGPLASIFDLNRIMGLHRGMRGAKTMLRAINRIRIGSLSRPESLLRVMLVRAGLPEALPNTRVYDLNGRLLSMPDLCWPKFRVLIEYQGDGHRTSKGKFRSDITRLEEYQDGDWTAIQASADDVFGDPNPFAARVWRRLVAQGWNPKRRQLRQIVGARR